MIEGSHSLVCSLYFSTEENVIHLFIACLVNLQFRKRASAWLGLEIIEEKEFIVGH